MTAPLHAREIKGKGRWYGSCGDGCPFGDDLLISVTNAQGVVAKPALVPSAVKITAAAAWERLPLMVAHSREPENGDQGCDKRRVAERCGVCRFCVTAAIKKEHDNIWEHARDTGTRVHTHAHAHVIGQPMQLDAEVEPFKMQYLFALDRLGVDIDKHVEAAETTIIDRRNKYAGTGDVWLWLPFDTDGNYTPRKRWLWLVDIKTSLTKPADVVYADQVLQLAGLRYAPKAILPDDTEIDVPKFAGAALLNLRRNDWRLIPLPADRVAHKAFVNAVGLQTFMQDQDTKTWKPIVLPQPTEAVA